MPLIKSLKKTYCIFNQSVVYYSEVKQLNSTFKLVREAEKEKDDAYDL